MQTCVKFWQSVVFFAKVALTLVGSSVALAVNSWGLTLDTPYGKDTVPDNPKRIVLLDMGAADNLLYLGETSRVVGIARADYFPDYLQNAYKDKVGVGLLGQPDFEAIANLNPDLIITTIRAQKSEEELRKIAPVLRADIAYGKAYDSIKLNLRNLGKLTNKNAQVETMIKNWDKQVASIRNASKGKNALVLQLRDRKLAAFGPKSHYSMIYEDLGFTPVDPKLDSDRLGVNVSYEYVKETNPQYIFVVDRNYAHSNIEGSVADVFKTPLLASTQAVKNNNLVTLHSKLWFYVTGGYKATTEMFEQILQVLKASK